MECCSSYDVGNAYIWKVEILPIKSSIKYFYVKDPDTQLHVDATSDTEIEVDSDGVWSVGCGKENSDEGIEKGSIVDIFCVEEDVLPNARGGFSPDTPSGVENVFRGVMGK